MGNALSAGADRLRFTRFFCQKKPPHMATESNNGLEILLKYAIAPRPIHEAQTDYPVCDSGVPRYDPRRASDALVGDTGVRAGRLAPVIGGAQGGGGVPDDEPPRVAPGDFSRTMRWMAAIFCGSE